MPRPKELALGELIEVWVTSITRYLAGETICAWQPWAQARFWFNKGGKRFDKAGWTATHTAMVRRRREELEAAGWIVTEEDQNRFRVGRQVAVLVGKIDLIGRRQTGEGGRLQAWVEDCKTGDERPEHWWQVLIYMLAAPLFFPDLKGAEITGAVTYQEGDTTTIAQDELTPERVQAIVGAVRMVAGAKPARAPSVRGCKFCDITAKDCSDRIDTPEPVPADAGGLF